MLRAGGHAKRLARRAPFHGERRAVLEAPVTARGAAGEAAGASGKPASNASGGGLLKLGVGLAALGGGGAILYPFARERFLEAPAEPAAAPAAEEKTPKKTKAVKAPASPKAEAEASAEDRRRSLRAALRAALEAVGGPKPPTTTAIAELRSAVSLAEQGPLKDDEALQAARDQLQRIERADQARDKYAKAHDAMTGALAQELLSEGRAALQEMAAAASTLTSLGQDVQEDGLTPQADLEAQLAVAERKAAAHADWLRHRAALQEAVSGRDAAACKREMLAISHAEVALRDLKQDIPADDGLLSNSLVLVHELEAQGTVEEDSKADRVMTLEELELQEEATSRRLEALAMLEYAVAARSPEQCQQALLAAKEAGVDSCPAVDVAKLLAEPRTLSDMLSKAPDELKEARRANGLAVSDFTDAAKAAVATMDEQELREKAAGLAAEIARSQNAHLVELQTQLNDAEVMLQRKCAERMQRARARFLEEREIVEKKQRVALKKEYDHLFPALDTASLEDDHEVRQPKSLQDCAAPMLAAEAGGRSEPPRRSLGDRLRSWKSAVYHAPGGLLRRMRGAASANSVPASA